MGRERKTGCLPFKIGKQDPRTKFTAKEEIKVNFAVFRNRVRLVFEFRDSNFLSYDHR